MVIYSNSYKRRKIDIYVNGFYNCSTNMQTTCKAAKLRYLELNPTIAPKTVKCLFDKKPR